MTVPTGDLRDHARKRVLLQASIISAAGAHRARINDLTISGVRLTCNPPLEPDTDVIFKRNATFVAARVVWVVGSSAGIEFYRPPLPQEAPDAAEDEFEEG
jgi:hypothetical protein